MATEFIFEGESFTLATPEEFRRAVMFGRLVSRDTKAKIVRYELDGRVYVMSHNDLQAIKAESIT